MTEICLIVIGILCLYLFVDAIYDFDFDYTKEKELLLWYNSKQTRKYIKLW